MSINNYKIQIVTRHTPLPVEDGAGYYVWDIASYLKENGFRIQIVWVKPEEWIVRKGFVVVPHSIAGIADLRIMGGISAGRFMVFPGIWWLPFKARLLDTIKKILIRLGMSFFFRKRKKYIVTGPSGADNELPWNSAPSAGEISFFKQCFNRFAPHIVITNYCWMNPILRETKSGGRCHSICITHDVQYQRSELWISMGLEQKSASITKELEKEYLSSVDIIAAITDYDRGVFQTMMPGRKIISVYHAAEPHFQKGDPIPGRCLFVGGFAKTNAEGLRWFLYDVWPKIINQQPAATLHVCGNVCRSFDAAHRNVKFMGRLESLDREYAEAEEVVIPVLYGSGVNSKLIEALSFGKACVTTGAGIKGLPEAAEAVICAGSSDQFAEAVIRLFKDEKLRKHYEDAGRKFVVNNLSREHCYRPLVDNISNALACGL